MELLVSAFERRAHSPAGLQLIGNAAKIAVAHVREPYDPPVGLQEQALDLAVQLSGVPKGGVTIDRDPDTLTSHHDVTVGQLVSFAAGGRVVDYGAGRSRLLDEFQGISETVAADIKPPHLAYQKQQGHRTLLANENDPTIPLASDSVRFFHASYSVPYWSLSPTHAARTAQEVIRVLEPGGIAMIGSTTGRYEQRAYEDMLSQSRGQDDAVLPEFDRPDRFDSYTRNGFVWETLGAVVSGRVKAVGTRFPQPTVPGADPAYHYPNFLMIRKTD